MDEVYLISGWKGHPAGHKPPRPSRRRRQKGRRGRGTGVLLQMLFHTDGSKVRQALRDTTVVELCQLPT